ncbi:MAG: hypothetical protein GEU99_18765 [Luteitalea sp.]|nr:hypothetical protein [Luteitalea sp.]
MIPGTTPARSDSTELRTIRRDLDRVSQDRYVGPFVFALIAMGLGERDRALFWLEKLHAMSGWIPFLPLQEELVSLHDAPRFRVIVADIRPRPTLLQKPVETQ